MVERTGGTCLARTERVEAINEARDQGRYLEIRGDAGVGKSGLLKHFAELFATEGRIVVLSPGRTQPHGWITMRGVLGFTGTARELLSDLASDGGAALFIDNLDSFNDDGERRTVNDLLRAASEVAGVTVLTTARRNFGIGEPSWLDANAIAALVPSSPVVIEELSEAEVTELGEAEPRLKNLLAKGHPARDVVRNLYARATACACTALHHRAVQHPLAIICTRVVDARAAQYFSDEFGRPRRHRCVRTSLGKCPVKVSDADREQSPGSRGKPISPAVDSYRNGYFRAAECCGGGTGSC